jgi:hypothetical protein
MFCETLSLFGLQMSPLQLQPYSNHVNNCYLTFHIDFVYVFSVVIRTLFSPTDLAAAGGMGRAILLLR